MITTSKDSDSPIKDLKTAFDARKAFYSNRASCVFPIYINATSDLHIVFLNYWTLKSQIHADHLLFNFRIYDCSGNLVLKKGVSKISNHNQLSMKSMLNEANALNQEKFQGMVEVEVISTENIRFSFPGVTGIYQSGNLFSAVHAAGRVKNTDEPQDVSSAEESNWTCKFSDKISPFFHYFVGPVRPRSPHLIVRLRNPDGTIHSEKSISIADMGPFSSKTFFADEIFELKNIPDDSFLSVSVEHGSCFPRLVVGNYFRDIDFYEVTHSFTVIEAVDYCPMDASSKYQSMLCAYKSDDLNLTFRVFPTNCDGAFDYDVFSQKAGAIEMQKRDERISVTPQTKSIRYDLSSDENSVCLRMQGASVPSRFNASFIYTVKNTASRFSTDIASGAKSVVCPPMYRQWGQGYVNDGFDTVVLVRNCSHRPEQTTDARGYFTVYGSNIERKIHFEVKAESAKAIKLSDIVSMPASEKDDPQFLSWLLEMDVPTCDSFWVSYRNRDGAVFGEHGF